MKRKFYHQLADQSITKKLMSKDIAEQIIRSPEVELMPLLNAAYEVRKALVGKQVTIHIINNTQNGYCPEDCHYCVQAKSSKADIAEYPLKSDQEIMTEAKNAYEKGAHRYCMVFAGRGPSEKRIDHLAGLIKDIKKQYAIEVCVSAGLLDQNKAKTLKEAGLDRLNHNLNTSAQHYPKICTTHTYEDRLQTLSAARQVGLQLCSGVILGMGEKAEDILEMVYTLSEMKVESIPVNFYIPIKGSQLGEIRSLSPEYCLRVLCLYRFLNPSAEIRIAAGREIHLRSMEVMALYPANSLFLDGYLNAKGGGRAKTFQMIKDAGFTIESDHSLEDLLLNEESSYTQDCVDQATKVRTKDLSELRPHL